MFRGQTVHEALPQTPPKWTSHGMPQTSRTIGRLHLQNGWMKCLICMLLASHENEKNHYSLDAQLDRSFSSHWGKLIFMCKKIWSWSPWGRVTGGVRGVDDPALRSWSWRTCMMDSLINAFNYFTNFESNCFSNGVSSLHGGLITKAIV